MIRLFVCVMSAPTLSFRSNAHRLTEKRLNDAEKRQQEHGNRGSASKSPAVFVVHQARTRREFADEENVTRVEEAHEPDTQQIEHARGEKLHSYRHQDSGRVAYDAEGSVGEASDRGCRARFEVAEPLVHEDGQSRECEHDHGEEVNRPHDPAQRARGEKAVDDIHAAPKNGKDGDEHQRAWLPPVSPRDVLPNTHARRAEAVQPVVVEGCERGDEEQREHQHDPDPTPERHEAAHVEDALDHDGRGLVDCEGEPDETESAHFQYLP